jgi:PAS domain S-box-containing protein
MTRSPLPGGVRMRADVLGPAATEFHDFEDFFENGAIGLHLVNGEGVILRANKAELDLMGYRAEEYIGCHIADFHADADVIADILTRLTAGERLHRYPARLKAKDGSIKHVLISSSVLFRDGDFVNTRCFSVDVTASVAVEAARLDAERRLADQARRLEQLFQLAPSFMALLGGPDHVFEVQNDAYTRLVGGRQFTGLPIRLALPELDGQGFHELLDQVYATGEAYTSQRAKVQLATGIDGGVEDRYLDFVYQPVRDDRGAVTGVFVEGIDVTHHVQVEDALRASEARFQAIVDCIDQMIWSTRPDGFHDYYNQRWYDYTGVPPGSTDGDRWNGMFHPEDQERAWAVWRNSLATGVTYHIEYRLRHRSGKYRWVLGRAQPLRDAQARIIRWYGTCTDIQEIVEAREVLARSRADLQREIEIRTAERNQLWRNSRDLLVVVDRQGVFQSASPAWEKLLGWAPHEVEGRNHLSFVHPEDHAGSENALRDASQRELPVFENRVLHKDGSHRWISWVASPEGDLIYAAGPHVTEEKQAAAELARAQEALRQSQKMEAIGQLTGGVAHDFNNLLTVIRASADLLRRRDLDEARRRRYVDAISDTADRAAKLTGQLLAFSRRQALTPQVFDVAATLDNLIAMLRTVLGARVDLTLDVSLRPATVEADLSQFETALVNLVANGRDAMNGEGELLIRVSLPDEVPGHPGAPDSFVLIAVADSGCGIPQDRIEQIFEPFFTTKELGRGTGLGLSQVYGFVRQSGGEVAVESELGVGTTLKIYLPRTDKPLEKMIVASAVGRQPRQHGVVLVVEDNPQVGEFSTRLLEDLGFQTVFAPNAVAALELLDASPGGFDLVFSDVVMPGLDGVGLGHEVRRRYPDLPFVLTSGYSEVIARQGTQGFELLQKPYSVESLSHVLRQALAAGKRI